MALGVNELKPKTCILYEGQPYLIVSTHHLKMQQRRPVVQTIMKNVINGKVLERNFAQSDIFEEADMEKMKVKYLYAHKDQHWFCEESNPSKRFELGEDVLGNSAKFLKANTIIEAILFNQKIVNIELPVKMDLKVVEAPPANRGNTAQGGSKQIKLETGAIINAPLFIEEGDIIRINTETGDYAERVDKGK